MCIRDRPYVTYQTQSFTFTDEEAAEEADKSTDMLVGGDGYFVAVSYTHLDVYKRQRMDISMEWPFGYSRPVQCHLPFGQI